MAQPEYIGVKDIEGPFILVENVSGVGYGELVDIRDSRGVRRHGQVKSLSEKATLVQVFTGTEELVPNTTKVPSTVSASRATAAARYMEAGA